MLGLQPTALPTMGREGVRYAVDCIRYIPQRNEKQGGLVTMGHPLRYTFLVLCGIGVIACGVYLKYSPAGCALLSAIPYCNEYTAQLRELEPKIRGFLIPIFRWIDGVVRGHLSLFAGGYALIVLYLFTQARYWDRGWELFGSFFIAGVILGAWFFGGLWIATTCLGIHHASSSSLAGLCYALLVIVLSLSFWIAAPAYLLFFLFYILLFLPSAAWVLLRLTVRAPFLLWHYLHYLFVPHPVERVLKKYEKVRLDRGAKIDPDALAEEMKQAGYDPTREGLPPWWKSRNWERRLRDIIAIRGRMRAEKQVADEDIEDIIKTKRRRR